MITTKEIEYDDPVIKIEHAGLRYDVPREQVGTFKEFAIRKVQGKIVNEQFWALKDISLCINRGEVIGVIGQNGAGKSTLLKLIAKVLKPTTGRVWVRGKVAPLLSVSAGFHHELTGRENIFLNGTLLGYSQKHIKERFDHIVEFSELEDFIEMPVRTYSSGMVARLGFAVATDTQPEILIVDEVLAVGDEAFQAKCFQRIETYQAQGTTTLLVTHSVDRIRKYSHRVAWMHKGELKMIGATEEIVSSYVEVSNLIPNKPVETPYYKRRRKRF